MLGAHPCMGLTHTQYMGYIRHFLSVQLWTVSTDNGRLICLEHLRCYQTNRLQLSKHYRVALPVHAEPAALGGLPSCSRSREAQTAVPRQRAGVHGITFLSTQTLLHVQTHYTTHGSMRSPSVPLKDFPIPHPKPSRHGVPSKELWGKRRTPSGKHVLALRFSAFPPKKTSRKEAQRCVEVRVYCCAAPIVLLRGVLGAGVWVLACADVAHVCTISGVGESGRVFSSPCWVTLPPTLHARA